MPQHTPQEAGKNVQAQIALALQQGTLPGQLNEVLRNIGGGVQQFGRDVTDKGVLGIARDLPLDLARALGSLPGAETASRTAISALAGGPFANSLIPQRGQTETAPELGPLQGPAQPRDLTPQQQAVAPSQPSIAPQPFQPPNIQLPQPQAVPPPDFSAARSALGPIPEAQQIGGAESLSRTLGGAAAGGLQALNTGGGRVGSLGEVIAGLGAGVAGARQGVGSENRQLEETNRVAVAERQRELARVGVAEAAATAQQDTASAEAFARRAESQSEIDMFQARLAWEAIQPIVIGSSGFLDRATGQFHPTADREAVQLSNYIKVAEMQRAFGSDKVIQWAGNTITKIGLSDAEQYSAEVAKVAGGDPRVVQALVQFLRDQNRAEQGENIQREFDGEDITAGNIDQQAKIASVAISNLITMHMISKQARESGQPDPFEGLFEQYEVMVNGISTPITATEVLDTLGLGQ